MPMWLQKLYKGELTSAGVNCDHHDHGHDEDGCGCSGGCSGGCGGCGAPRIILEGKMRERPVKFITQVHLMTVLKFDSHMTGENRLVICGYR